MNYKIVLKSVHFPPSLLTNGIHILLRRISKEGYPAEKWITTCNENESLSSSLSLYTSLIF
ncbi:MAG: hypothetical protein ACXWEW_08545 [Nitrososphaeraceae archaeon]